MKAARFHNRDDVRVESIPQPECQPGEIKMRPAFAGICGTDLHEYRSGPVLIPEKPHPITGTKRPVTLGHEFSGIITEVGDGVHHLSQGQRAVVRPTIYDEKCPPCQQGVQHCCDNIGFIGLSGYGGGMAEYVTAPANHFYAIPENVSLEVGALVEPLSVAWHAINVSPFKPGDATVVVGGGPIGIAVVQILKLQGASKIIVIEPTENRQRLASEFGATEVLDPGREDVPERVRSVTHRTGADVVFDTAGVEKALNGVIPACRTHGTIVNIAVWEKGPQFDVNELMYNEVNYVGAALYDEMAFKQVIEALSHRTLNPEKMITSKIKLDEVVENGLKALIEHKENHCKILIDVQAA